MLAAYVAAGGSVTDASNAVATRVSEVLADLVEPAKVTALEKLGEGERAMQIATGWLRARAAPQVGAKEGLE